VGLIGLSLFALNACTEPNDHTAQAPVGKEMYAQYCASCHGNNGDLGISDAADLTVSRTSLDEKIYTISNGSENGKMTPYKGLLSEKDIDAVAHYVETLKK